MLYWIFLLLVLAALVWERRTVRMWRAKIPTVIHVHGTRGKSGTTRNLAALFRQHGYTVLAKTTGDAPEYILPDGSVAPVRRYGPARIQEHARILGKAAGMNADVLVVEGMALQAETVCKSEEILRASHAVIVNVRPDHAETMGPGRQGVLDTLGLMIPERRILFTSREKGARELCAAAAGKRSECVVVESSPLAQPKHLAEAVCSRLMGDAWSAAPDPDRQAPGTEAGVSPPVFRKDVDDISLSFMDLFSANDVESSRMILREPRPGRAAQAQLRLALLATRADRPLRTKAFLEWLADDQDFDFVLPVGGHSWYSALWAAAHKKKRVIRLLNPWLRPDALQTRILTLGKAAGVRCIAVTGLGNTHGYGEKWRGFLAAWEKETC